MAALGWLLNLGFAGGTTHDETVGGADSVEGEVFQGRGVVGEVYQSTQVEGETHETNVTVGEVY